MRLTLERFLLMEPETSPHRPGESNSEQRQQLIELVRVTEMSKFTRSRRLGCSSQVSYQKNGFKTPSLQDGFAGFSISANTKG
jgi:hypothetical protein